MDKRIHILVLLSFLIFGVSETIYAQTITGNVHGGGEMAQVGGDANVKILNGVINGKVFGAGQGEAGHSAKAEVTGNTNVVIGQE